MVFTSANKTKKTFMMTLLNVHLLQLFLILPNSCPNFFNSNLITKFGGSITDVYGLRMNVTMIADESANKNQVEKNDADDKHTVDKSTVRIYAADKNAVRDTVNKSKSLITDENTNTTTANKGENSTQINRVKIVKNIPEDEEIFYIDLNEERNNNINLELMADKKNLGVVDDDQSSLRLREVASQIVNLQKLIENETQTPGAPDICRRQKFAKFAVGTEFEILSRVMYPNNTSLSQQNLETIKEGLDEYMWFFKSLQEQNRKLQEIEYSRVLAKKKKLKEQQKVLEHLKHVQSTTTATTACTNKDDEQKQLADKKNIFKLKTSINDELDDHEEDDEDHISSTRDYQNHRDMNDLRATRRGVVEDSSLEEQGMNVEFSCNPNVKLLLKMQ